jgi:hypothetical protein
MHLEMTGVVNFRAAGSCLADYRPSDPNRACLPTWSATVPACLLSSGLGLELELNRCNGFTTGKTHTIPFGLGFGSKLCLCKPNIFAPTKCLSSDPIVT